jgi:DNA repair photolyase
VLLGAASEPWQPAEERMRLTRTLLEEMLKLAPLDLQVHTRSSLIARDTDLLRDLSQRGRVTVAFSLASLEERTNRLLEPRAPSAFRRLAAIEGLARAGLLVGVRLSPLPPSVRPEELEALLKRAAHAGARFAELGPLVLSASERARLLGYVGQALPDEALRLRRVLMRSAVRPEEVQALHQAFQEACERLGLVPLEAPPQGPQTGGGPAVRTPAQLSLFPTH